MEFIKHDWQPYVPTAEDGPAHPGQVVERCAFCRLFRVYEERSGVPSHVGECNVPALNCKVEADGTTVTVDVIDLLELWFEGKTAAGERLRFPIESEWRVL